MVMSETLPLATVKSRFSEIVDRVERQQDIVVVACNGQPVAMLISLTISGVSTRRSL